MIVEPQITLELEIRGWDRSESSSDRQLHRAVEICQKLCIGTGASLLKQLIKHPLGFVLRYRCRDALERHQIPLIKGSKNVKFRPLRAIFRVASANSTNKGHPDIVTPTRMPMQIPTKASTPACLAHALAHAAPLTIVFACPQH
jgi:hypothetical protein